MLASYLASFSAFVFVYIRFKMCWSCGEGSATDVLGGWIRCEETAQRANGIIRRLAPSQTVRDSFSKPRIYCQAVCRCKLGTELDCLEMKSVTAYQGSDGLKNEKKEELRKTPPKPLAFTRRNASPRSSDSCAWTPL